MVKAQTFKRGKIIKAILRYTNMMEQAKHETEDYAMREIKARNMGDEKPAEYFRELKESNNARFVAYRYVVGDLRYEFGITDEELKDGEEE